MAKATYTTTIEANAAVLSNVLDPHEFSITLPTSAGAYLGTAVGSLGISYALIAAGNGDIETTQFVAYFGASLFGGLGVGTATSAAMVFKSWQFIRQMSQRRTETVEEEAEEAQPWVEPERPSFLPSFVENVEGGFRRVQHDLTRRELRILSTRAQEGERFPTREQLVGELGFANNAARISGLTKELRRKGIIDAKMLWTAQGVDWLGDELTHNPPTPNVRR